MQAPSLEEVIRSHIALPAGTNSGGFFPVLCKVCNDHGRKGKRAGFKFEGDSVVYNCFNCGHAAVYNPREHSNMSGKMVTVLEAFSIPKSDWQSVLLKGLQIRQSAEGEDHTTPFRSIEPPSVTMPSFFYPLTDDPTDEWSQAAIEYLHHRGIHWSQYPFHVVRKEEHPDNARWYGRLIIPTYYRKNLVFWQGRDLTDLHQRKYLSLNIPRDRILYGYDEIERYSSDPLYITEGWFDAFNLKGVAVYGSKMTADQIKWINRSSRQKVVVPDRYGDGFLLGQQALDLGWDISTPDIGECKDVNEAATKYGLLYTAMSVKQHTYGGMVGATRLTMYCDGASNRQEKSKNTSSGAGR